MNKNKVAIITGASRGIGHAVAKGLIEDGYDVVLLARSESKLRELAEYAKNRGRNAHVICADMANFISVENAINAIINEWGRVDVLVNNAGIYRDGSLQASLEDYQALFDVNVKAQLVLLRAVLPVMQKQKSGLVANIASIAGKVGYDGLGAYGSSKFAFVGLSESLYHEYSASGIKITAICPSYVATDMAKGAPISESEMIQSKDILQTIRWLLQLSPGALVKEVIIDTQ